MLTPQLKILIVLLAISLIVWIVLILYKRKLEQEVEDKVLLGTTPERLSEKQAALLQKVDKASKPIWIFGTLTVLLVIATVGLWLYQGLMGS